MHRKLHSLPPVTSTSLLNNGLIFPVWFLSLSISAHAELAQTDSVHSITALKDEILWLKEETFVTTATKTLEDIKKSGATVSIITSQDLQKMGARNLMDALKRLPGLGINQMTMGMSAVEVRGVKTDFGEKVLFLINGHPINNNLVNGGAHSSYNNFIVDDIKRVEVVRGPGSALYGANAFVAVINIITKDAADINGTKVTVGTGSYRSRKANLQVGDTFGELDLAANLNVYDTDGHKGEVASDAINRSGISDYWNKRYEFGLQLDYGDFSFQSKYLQRKSGPYLGANNVLNDDSEQDYVEYFGELTYQRSLSNQLSMSAKVYFDHFQFDNLWEIFPENFIDPDGNTYPDGLLLRSPIEHDKTGGELQLEYQINSDHKLLTGLMTEHQSQYNVELFSNGGSGPMQNISSFANWNGSHNRYIFAAFIQDIWDINEELRVIAGTRYDRYSDFGSSVNPRISMTWSFSDHYSLMASYGSAFRAPTLGELYNINNPSIVGNPEVEPEEIETYELSLAGDITKKTNFKITGFHNNISDLIGAIPSATAASKSENIGKLSVDGAELEVSSRMHDGSTLSFNYTYQRAINEVSDDRAANVPRQKLNAAFNYRHSRFVNLFTGLNHRGALPRVSGDSRSALGSHTTVDVALNVHGASDSWSVTASIYNLFDKTWFDPSQNGAMLSDYPKEGRNFWIETSFKL
jgi:iron complex outermembrane receptor protein